MTDNASIIQKVRKLLALADGNKNEHEREVAMKLAMDLVSKHNLSMTKLCGQSKPNNVCAIEHSFPRTRWIEYIVDAACELYYTDHYISIRKTYMFVGTPENIAVSIDVAEWLIASIRYESNKLYKDSYQRRSFRLGAAWTILCRAIDLVIEEKYPAQPTTSSTSLVVIRDQLVKANEDYLSRLNLNRPRLRRKLYVDQDSFDSGSHYGEGVRLGKQPKRIPQFV